MDELKLINMNGVDTISSYELLRSINQARMLEDKGGKTHADFMKAIRNELQGGEGKFSSSYLNKQNKEQPCYNLPYREAMLMAMRESRIVRSKVMDWIDGMHAPAIEKDPIKLLEYAVASLKEASKEASDKSVKLYLPSYIAAQLDVKPKEVNEALESMGLQTLVIKPIKGERKYFRFTTEEGAKFGRVETDCASGRSLGWRKEVIGMVAESIPGGK